MTDEINPLDYVYDLETIPNFFSCVVTHPYSGSRWIFEVSDWQNDAAQFVQFMYALQANGCRLIGFNNFYFDYQILHHLLLIGPTFTAADAFQKTDMLINGGRDANFKLTVWGGNHLIQQIDLFLIHHFDNFAKSTSLKETEFNMRSSNIGDLPFEPGVPIPEHMRKIVIEYNCHDVNETWEFAKYSRPMISFREELVASMGSDVLNYNDTKIGKKYFESELRRIAPHLLGTYKNKRQTKRDLIKLADVILPKIEFETAPLQNVLRFLRATTITQTKAPPELKDLSATLGGFTMHVGAGGGHGSVDRQCVKPRDGWRLVDVDVASYYPSIAIVNRFYPAHLSETFCDIYADVANQRKQHKKKTAPNEMLKLALNGVYGDSANPHSIFLDPQYTMQVTINGQLLLYLLTEKILTHTNGEMIQLNTDGITFLIPEKEHSMAMKICKWWEEFTGLVLEHADYEAMWIRDVNSYMAKSTDGYVKRIGAYAHETQRENPATREVKWGKDHSALIVPKAAEAEMVNGVPVREFIMNHHDPYDFMLRHKVAGKVKLRLMNEGDVDPDPNHPTAGQRLQKVTRYYMAKTGGALQTIHPPVVRNPEKERIIGVNVGWKVATCNNIKEFDGSNVDYEWYVAEAEKLVIR